MEIEILQVLWNSWSFMYHSYFRYVGTPGASGTPCIPNTLGTPGPPIGRYVASYGWAKLLVLWGVMAWGWREAQEEKGSKNYMKVSSLLKPSTSHLPDTLLLSSSQM